MASSEATNLHHAVLSHCSFALWTYICPIVLLAGLATAAIDGLVQFDLFPNPPDG